MLVSRVIQRSSTKSDRGIIPSAVLIEALKVDDRSGKAVSGLGVEVKWAVAARTSVPAVGGVCHAFCDYQSTWLNI